MGRVIAAANRKGGVGKTTTTVALARALNSQFQKSVVVVDTDPQSSASLSLAGESLLDFAKEKFLESYLAESKSKSRLAFAETQIGADQGKPMSLVPCSPELWELEADLFRTEPVWFKNQRAAATRFAALVSKLRKSYEYILIDTPPGRGLLTSPILMAADLLLVPCTPDRISTWGLDKFADELARWSPDLRPKTRILWTLFDGVATSWEAFVKDYATGGKVKALEERMPSRVEIARGVVRDADDTFERRFPRDAAPLLIRIAEEVMGTLDRLEEE